MLRRDTCGYFRRLAIASAIMPTMTPAIMDSHGNPAMVGGVSPLDVLVDASAVTVVVVDVVNSTVTAMIVVYELVRAVRIPFDVKVDVLDTTRVVCDETLGVNSSVVTVLPLDELNELIFEL